MEQTNLPLLNPIPFTTPDISAVECNLPKDFEHIPRAAAVVVHILQAQRNVAVAVVEANVVLGG